MATSARVFNDFSVESLANYLVAGPPPNENTQISLLRASFDPYPQWHQRSPLQCWTRQDIQLACAITQLLRDLEGIDSWNHQPRQSWRGLPGRTQLMQQLTALQQTAETNQEIYAVVFLDLDRFQNVNNTLGHSAGDQLLQFVTQRLKAHLSQDSKLLGHWSSDQFIIIFRHLNQLDSGEIEQRVARIGDCFKAPFSFEHQASISKPVGEWRSHLMMAQSLRVCF